MQRCIPRILPPWTWRAMGSMDVRSSALHWPTMELKKCSRGSLRDVLPGMNAGASPYAVPSPIEGSGTAWVLLGSWALSPARPTPIHPRHECRGFSALLVKREAIFESEVDSNPPLIFKYTGGSELSKRMDANK